MKHEFLKCSLAALGAVFAAGGCASYSNTNQAMIPYKVAAILPLGSDLPIGTTFAFDQMPQDIYDARALGATTAILINITNGLHTNAVMFPDIKLTETNHYGLDVGYQGFLSLAANYASSVDIFLQVRGASSVAVSEADAYRAFTVVTNYTYGTPATNNASRALLDPAYADDFARLRLATAKGGIKNVFTGNPYFYNQANAIFRMVTQVFYATNITITFKPRSALQLGLDTALLSSVADLPDLTNNVMRAVDGSYVVNYASPAPIAFAYRSTLFKVYFGPMESGKKVHPWNGQVDRFIEKK